MMVAKVAVLATKQALIKRAAIVAGKRGAPTTHLSGLQCTQMYPTSTGVQLRAGMDTPHATWSLFIIGQHDIRQGDWLSLDGSDYTIQGLQVWEFPGEQGAYTQLTVEEAQS